MTQRTTGDRRLEPRFAERLSVRIEDLGDPDNPGPDKYDQVTRDLSRGGLFVETTSRPAVGSEVALSVEVRPGCYANMTAEVVRHEEEDGEHGRGGIGLRIVGQTSSAFMLFCDELERVDKAHKTGDLEPARSSA